MAALPLVVVLLLMCLRAAAEFAMMYEHGSDAQMGIWLMAMIFMLALWFATGALIGGLLALLWRRRWAFRILFVLLVAWCVAICAQSLDYYRGARALADAANPLTSSDRLEDLAHFNSPISGSELDNRIASHPNVTAETLRELYERDPFGAPWGLASNPKTPEDILLLLAKRSNKQIRESLLENPALPKSARDELMRFRD